MKTKTKRNRNLVVFTLATLSILLLTFKPVVGFISEISTSYYPEGTAWGPMGGPMVDQRDTAIVFYILMAIYVVVIVWLFVKVCKLIYEH